jgi:hypothetical protein
MNILFLLTSSFFPVLVGCQIGFSACVWQQAHGRNLSLYDKSGPHIIKPGHDAQTRSSIESTIREFLWNHWGQRRLGYLVVSRYSKEGESITYSYYLEPDKKGVWHIQVTINRHLSVPGGSKTRYKETDKYAVYSVERLRISKAGVEEETIKPERYRLILKDQKGRVRAEL